MSEADGDDLLVVRAALDESMSMLRTVSDPEVRVRDAELFIAAALFHTYVALAESGRAETARAHVDEALERTRNALETLQAIPSSDPTVDRLLSVLARCLGALRRPKFPVLEEGLELPRHGAKRPPLRASVGAPSILDPERPVLMPSVALVEPPSQPPLSIELVRPAGLLPVDTLEALDRQLAAAEAEAAGMDEPPREPAPARVEAEAARAPRPQVDAALYGAQLRRSEVEFDRARSLLEDIAAMSVMRLPDDGDVWHELEPVERRLLARLDAIVACGTWAFPKLVDLLEERPVPDPELTWALIFVHGSIAGRDMLDAVERMVNGSDLSEPVMYQAVLDALAHAPHAGIVGVARRWLGAGEALRRALGVEVLTRRGSIYSEEADRAAKDDSVVVVRAAARAYEVVAQPPTASTLTPLLFHDDDEVTRAAIETALARGMGAGYRRAAQLVEQVGPERAQAIRYLALAGDKRDRELIHRCAASTASGVVLGAVGWYGDLELVPYLLAQLRNGEVAAVGALQRLTGASLEDEAPDPEYEEDEVPFRRERRPPEQGLLLSADPDRWQAWWDRYRSGANREERHRWGHRWTVADSFFEVEEAATTLADRRAAYLELTSRSGVKSSLDQNAFVVRQRRQVDAWRTMLGPSGLSAGTGAWPQRLDG